MAIKIFIVTIMVSTVSLTESRMMQEMGLGAWLWGMILITLTEVGDLPTVGGTIS